MADLVDKLIAVAKQQKLSSNYLRQAALASTTNEVIKYYKKKKPETTEEQLVEWYIGEVYKSAKMAQYLENIGIQKSDYEVACREGIEQAKADIANPAPKVVKVGRNELCPCGSGKKYKKCCGR